MDRDDYEQAVRKHKDRVHSHAVWVLHGREDSRDVAQEALLRLWVHRSGVRPETAGSWLMKTTHNLCIDRLRRVNLRPEVDPERLELMEDDNGHGPERSAQSAELGQAIARALRALSARDRSVVLMRDAQGMSYDEIAGAVDLPLGTLKSILHRSRERLRRALTVAGVTP
jgi:RNA polymerase sigma-70 factor (ECF subfamily)